MNVVRKYWGNIRGEVRKVILVVDGEELLIEGEPDHVLLVVDMLEAAGS